RERRPARRWLAAGVSIAILGGAALVPLLRHPPRAPPVPASPAPAIAEVPRPTPPAPTPAPPPLAVAPPAALAPVWPPPHRRRAASPDRAGMAAEPRAPSAAPSRPETDPLLLLYMADIAHNDRDGAACLAALDGLPAGGWPPALAEHAQRRRATCEMLRGNCRKGLRMLEPLDGADVARASLLGNCPAGWFATIEDRVLAVAAQADEERYGDNQPARRQA